MENEKRKGGISVDTEHIFPVIKKWLYSDKEIFIRELISNACDAISKLKRLESLGEYESAEGEEYSVTVSLDKDAKTLTISDNGIGMNEEELTKYICNIALSGALDFIEKYESGDGASIIGHFGLGFYSAFMVADSVEIHSRSYKGGDAVHWTCSDGGEYMAETSDERVSHGTDVILHINSEGEEYLSKYNCESVIYKYCSFMPVDIFVEDANEEKKDDRKPINDKEPLWTKNASECTDEEYKAFYNKLFDDMRTPLFHIHINADYPLNFKGILYFPPIRSDYDTLEGQVKLYYNQVFVADNLKEVIPEYLLLLRGVLDCPELPLNVSRSYLQNSGYVSKISAHITKKVADKLNSLFSLERENYEKYWDDIRFFAEYGAMRDKKFYDRVKDILLLKLTDGSYVTVNEYIESASDDKKDKIFYTSDKVLQSQYVSMYTDAGIKVAELSGMLDTQFISFIESEMKVKFSRVDSDTDSLKKDGEKYENEALAELFKKVSGNEKTSVVFESLSDKSVPALLKISEESRRFADLMRIYSPEAPAPAIDETLILNSSSSLIRKLGALADSDKENGALKDAVDQIYSLSLLAQRQLTADELKKLLSGAYKALDSSLGAI
ncbi:MAG: molecular chaperone HtpG [Clostridia bacterium]|nr:molecular chaperone HtpG [Clostridia bacterium]